MTSISMLHPVHGCNYMCATIFKPCLHIGLSMTKAASSSNTLACTAIGAISACTKPFAECARLIMQLLSQQHKLRSRSRACCQEPVKTTEAVSCKAVD